MTFLDAKHLETNGDDLEKLASILHGSKRARARARALARGRRLAALGAGAWTPLAAHGDAASSREAAAPL